MRNRDDRGILVYREAVDWRQNYPDVDELLRYNREAKMAACKHQRVVERERADGTMASECLDCGRYG